MKTSGLFTVHGFKIPVRNNQPIRLVFFGDVHRDAPNHADGKWQEFLEYARGLKDAWFFGMGDYLDSTSTSERECLGQISARMHETFRNDVQALQLAKVEMMAKELKFMRGKIVGMLNGNHYFEFQSGINSDQKLCELLGAKYLGVCSFVRLYLSAFNRERAVDLFAHHGAGAARLVGGSMNRVAQMAEGAEADIYAMGHDHKRGAVPAIPRLFLNHSSRGGLKVESRETYVVRSGSFLKSYAPGTVSYAVDGASSPCSLGHVELLINLRDKKVSGKREQVLEIRSLV